MARAVLYTGPRCPKCAEAKRWLREHHIEFVEVDISQDAEAAKRLSERWITGIPALEVDGDFVVGYSPARYTTFFIGRSVVDFIKGSVG
ncbi:MAG: glutaredoxin family protein [Firmicutes bacterium]|nr:glutaredoxin family protein [Bacillota bacterium]